MICSACSFENPETSRFCGKCGAALLRPQHCGACGAENPPDFGFCGKCGASLASGAVVTPATESSDETEGAERRQITVVFCDLVNSTEMVSALDPEDYQRFLKTYHTTCATIVDHYAGHVAQFLGDGVLIYFGYPTAHEDDAQRAVLTALGIVRAASKLANPADPARRVAVRIGIHSGPVVTGEVGAGSTRERLVQGETVHLTARLQQQAEPGAVVMSDSTRLLVEGFFDTKPLGEQVLKGLSRPVGVHQVLRTTDVQSRFDAAAKRGLAPFVGRKEELSTLHRAFERAVAGRGQLALVTGEAGMGKSRLIRELRDTTGEIGARWLTCRCSPYDVNSAFQPFIDLATQTLGFEREDPPATQIEKLEVGLADLGLDVELHTPFLAAMLSIPPTGKYQPAPLTPQRLKDGIVQTLQAALFALANREPLVLVAEDLHWADPSTLGVLLNMAPPPQTTSMLLVLTYRPEFEPRVRSRSGVTQINLDRLDDDDVRSLIAQMARAQAGVSDAMLAELTEKSDGVPIFVEELTRWAITPMTTRRTSTSVSIPTTLRDSLLARLDRLGLGKQVVEEAAVIGRDFSLELLEAISTLQPSEVGEQLSVLVDEDLVQQVGLPPHARYIFRHALIRDAAYDLLLKTSRKHYHDRIVNALLTQIPQDARPEVVAYHASRGTTPAAAIPHWQRAAEEALRRSANDEAIASLHQALSLLGELPPEEAVSAEIMLQTTLGNAYAANRGFAAPLAEQAFSRAHELCETLGDVPQLFWILFGLQRYYFVRGDLEEGLALTEQMLRLANAPGQDPVAPMAANYAAGTIMAFVGQPKKSLEHFDRGIALDTPKRDVSYLRVTGGVDLLVCSYAASAMPLWLLGRTDEALERSRKSLELAQGLTPFDLAFAMNYIAWSHQQRGEVEDAWRVSNELVQMSDEFGLFFGYVARTYRGWAAAWGASAAASQMDGAGTSDIRAGIEGQRALGARLNETGWLGQLAECYLEHDNKEDAKKSLKEALDIVDKKGETVWLADLKRIESRLQRDPAEAERLLREALEVARSQGSLWLEFGSAMTYGNLLRSLNREDEARELVRGVYDKLEEGQETPRLRAAREFLGQQN